MEEERVNCSFLHYSVCICKGLDGKTEFFVKLMQKQYKNVVFDGKNKECIENFIKTVYLLIFIIIIINDLWGSD